MRVRLIFYSLAVIWLFSCEPENPPAPIIPPQVSTLEATEVTFNSAIVGGKIIEVGSEPITRKGVCFVKAITNTPEEFANTWPSTTNNVIESSDLSETFTVLMDNLSPNQTYYVRAFAESAAGLKYGEKIKFTTEFETITDIDGNIYRIWAIGSQTWTIDNFNATRLRDGTPIPNRLDGFYWTEYAPQEMAMCWYDNDKETHEMNYGAMYNWYAASHTLIAPEGWRVPTIYDYHDLASYLVKTYGQVTENYWSVGGYCKVPGYDFWEAPNKGANNRSFFSAMPGGRRVGPNDWAGRPDFFGIGYFAVIFPCDDFSGYANSMILLYDDLHMHTGSLLTKHSGASLRLIKIN